MGGDLRGCEPIQAGFSEGGDDVGLEPGMAAEPEIVSGAWMGNGDVSGQVTLPRSDRFRQGGHGGLTEVVKLGVASDEEDSFDRGKVCEQLGMPEGGAFGPRGTVAAAWIASGITEAGRDDGDGGVGVEGLAGNTEPESEPVAAGVVPGNA